MSRDFLLEIGCEEIPGWMLPAAEASLKELLWKELGARGLLEQEPIQTYSTPRRLVACCASLALAEPDRVSEVVGPPRSVALAPDGKPTRAAESFAAKQGVPVKSLVTVKTPKGEYVASRSHQKGRPAAEVLAEIVPGVIRGISFPRTMYWTSPAGMRFIRPIRWLLVLYGGKVVSVEIEGVKSDCTTRGHRLLGPAAVAVKSVEEYQRHLAEAFVVLDPQERQRIIARQADGILKREGLRRRADIQQLEELANLTEYPAVVRGEFDRQFLSLPSEVLITVMRHHQKYISVEDARGELAPCFLAVLDLDGDADGEIRRGHETVLAARFRDAHFFWQADQKRSLAERTRLLDQVLFQAQLGSYAKKVNRMVPLIEWIARHLVSTEGRRADIEAASRAAQLCKSDLTTEMVGEFPELQGIIGGLYARAQGEPEKVAKAIYEHYQPASAEAPCPATVEGSALALGDKLDTIAACFSAGLAPTGSRDPFALRRAGTGVVRIVVEGKFTFSLRAAVQQAVEGVIRGGLKVEDPARLAANILAFLEERARYVFRELRQHPFDEVNAVFAAGWDDLNETAARLEAVRRLRPSKDFEPVAAAFKRIRNILEQAGDGQARAAGAIAEDLLEAGPERELHDRFLELRPRVAALRQGHKYEEALRQIASLRPQVDRFFDKVLVMANDDRVRENRLTLLAQLLREFSTVADFSEFVTTPKG